jgi:hypothetical protein
VNSEVRSKPLNSRPPKAALYSIKPPICFGQAPRSSAGIHTGDPMMKSDEKCQKAGLMTRKLLLTAAIVTLTLAPSIGTGTAQARGFSGGGFGGGFHGGFGGGFHGGFGRGFHGGFGRGFYGGFGRGFYGGFGRGFYGGFGGFYPGLLPLWLFPILLLLLLIAYSLRPETAQPGLAWTAGAARWLAIAETGINDEPHWSSPERGDTPRTHCGRIGKWIVKRSRRIEMRLNPLCRLSRPAPSEYCNRGPEI